MPKEIKWTSKIDFEDEKKNNTSDISDGAIYGQTM